MCDLAKLQKRSVVKPPPQNRSNNSGYGNCNSEDSVSLRNRLVTDSKHKRHDDFYCLALEEKLRSKGVNFLMYEVPLFPTFQPHTMLCPVLFSYGIMLRDSVARIVSWMNYNQVLMPQPIDGLLQCAKESNCQVEKECRSYFTRTKKGGAKDLMAHQLYQLDNIAVRSLIGASVSMVKREGEEFKVGCRTSAWHVPFGNISASHVEEAKTVLEKFDVILILEDLNTEVGWKEQLTRVWGWTSFFPSSYTKKSAKKTPQIILNARTLRTLAELNKPDAQLFDWARARSRLMHV